MNMKIARLPDYLIFVSDQVSPDGGFDVESLNARFDEDYEAYFIAHEGDLIIEAWGLNDVIPWNFKRAYSVL